MSNINDFKIKDDILNDYWGRDEIVIIPQGIKKIERCALRYREMKKVVLPDGILEIGAGAFAECVQLEEINIPDTVEYIGDKAFALCQSLKKIKLPETAKVYESAFLRCDNLTIESDKDFEFKKISEMTDLSESYDFLIIDGELKRYNGYDTKIVIPDGITAIGSEVLPWNSKITDIVIPCSVKRIEDEAFRHQTNIKSVTIMDGVSEIGDKAFYECENLETITIPSSLTKIGDRAFSACSKLTITDKLDNVTSISDYVFSGCEKMADENGFVIVKNILFNCYSDSEFIVIPEGVTKISSYAFSKCKNMTNVSIPDSVTTIGGRAFDDCVNLASIIIPDNVSSLGWDVFMNCKKLSLISVSQKAFSNLSRVIGNGNVGVAVRENDSVCFYAYSVKSLGNSYNDYIKQQKWQEHDSELINNGPVYKYCSTARLFGMLGRLLNPVDLTEENQIEFKTYITKNIKKLVEAAITIKCTDIVKHIAALNLVETKNIKAVKSMLVEAGVEGFADLADLLPKPRKTEEKVANTKKTVTTAESLDDNDNSVGAEYAKKLKEIKADKTIKAMKLIGATLPETLLKDGTKAPEEIFKFILASYGALKTPEILKDADKAAELLSYSSLCQAMEEASDNLNVVLYPSLIPLICRYASPAQIKQLINAYDKWENWDKYGAKGRNAQKKFAESLVLSESKLAVAFLEKIKDGVKHFAEVRGINEDDVYSRYLFDFGFDKDGKRIFDVQTAAVEASLNADLLLKITDVATGEAVKTIPENGVNPDIYKKTVDELEDLVKSLRDAVKIKQNQLWKNYIDATEFAAVKWKEHYIENVFLNRVARIIVWSQGDSTFLLTEAGAITSDGKAYIITDTPIKVAHSMEMNKEDVISWQKYFASNNLKQPFEQIWEPVTDPADFREDRYSGCAINSGYLYQKKYGMYINWYATEYSENHSFRITGFSINAVPHSQNSDCVDIQSITYKKWTRRTNTVVAYLDKLTVYDRVLKDDVSIASYLLQFTLAQITEFIRLATENECKNVTAILLDYKNKNFTDFDPMEEFSFDL